MPNVDSIAKQVERVRRDDTARDAQMRRMHLILSNRASEVFKSVLPDDYPEPIVANTVRAAAEDLAMMVGVMPSLSAVGSSGMNESKRSRSDKLGRIIQAVVYQSSIGSRLPFAAVQQIAYGFTPLRVEPMFDEKRPHIHVDDALGAHFTFDRFRRLQSYFRVSRVTARQLADLYPNLAGRILMPSIYGADGGGEPLEVIRWWDDSVELMFVPQRKHLVLETVENRIGRIPVVIVEGDPSGEGQFPSMNDSVAVMAAKAELALLNLEAATKAVQAPIAVPADVDEFTLGPDAILRSNTPRDIGRVSLDIPNSAVFEVRTLDEELKKSTNFPDVRGGNTDASIVTGRGVQALLGGYDARVQQYQGKLGAGLADITSIALEIDKEFFGGESKTAYASVSGTSFEVTYTPARDIYSTNVAAEYGLLAGMDPNRSLVFGLQAMGAGLVSKRFVSENLPIALDVVEETKAMDVEGLRAAALAAVQGYAQAIPQMALQPEMGDPMQVITRIADVIDARKKGTPIEDALMAAFKPAPAPEQQAPVEDPMAALMGAGAPAGPGQAPAGAQVPQMPQQPPSMNQLLTQLNGDGSTRTSARQVRQSLI